MIKIYRFTRLVFGLNKSSFMLEGTLNIHFENYIGMFRELIERVKGRYVCGRLSGWGRKYK